MTARLPDELIELIQQESSKAIPKELSLLAETILARYGEAVQAILFYGSCLRTGQEKEGVVDLYVIVDAYMPAYDKPGFALLNWLLPPNVFYLEVPDGGGVIRAKFAVLSVADFQRGTSEAWVQSYLWARFAQPVRLLYTRSETTARQVHSALARAVVTFLGSVLPQFSSAFSARELWCRGLFLSYRSELRAEKQDQPTRLFDADRSHYERVTRSAMPAVPFEVEVIPQGDSVCYRANISARRRFLNRMAWQARCVQGKCLSVLRLTKGLFTFQGGLDYILWKIERHSGIRIPEDSALRRHPVSGIWVIFWRLYRRGGFR